MRAYINVWGRKYNIDSIRWHGKDISFISFRDENNDHYLVHQKTMYDKDNVEEMKGKPNKITHSDLEKCITWEESQ